jgi:hypothetical protein
MNPVRLSLAAETLFLLSVLILSAGFVGAEESGIHTLTLDDQKNHARFIQRLHPVQLDLLSARYPDFRILKLCEGHFSGGAQNELVLGVWKPESSKDSWKREVHRVGLIWNRKKWVMHIIDNEIERDLAISHSTPMRWQYAFKENEFSGDMKCGIESEFRENSDLTYGLGDKPIFDLRKKGLSHNKPVCFATDDVYNNWDCVVFSPKSGRFRLWFQQAHAD